MKIRIISDVHLNFNQSYKIADHDLQLLHKKKDNILTIVAGDISNSIDAEEKWLRDNYNRVIFIAGNHTIAYTNTDKTVLEIYELYKKRFPKKDDICFLENDYKIIDDIVFIGCTL
jgi:predicted phosphodiesterase